ncbi:PIN domain-containing protein [Streptomyces uncialis]|uniref:PIN domain-containing protein n=1 Tax=Streptomyces uncialis TaxID=1048205 RepID=UPI0038630644|nr:PIN domain-containing protein [Streptomyces uncialis]
MAFIALYDANVLYPSALRDLLIRVAQAGLVQAKWTDHILDETFRNLKANRPDLKPTRLDRTRELMVRAVRDCLVKGYEPLIDAVELPDPDDRHVLAAAIRAKAQVIVTFNLKDFPVRHLSPWDVEAVHPDAFVAAQIDLDPRVIYSQIQQIANGRVKPPTTVADILDRLERDGLVASAAALRTM